MYPDDPVINTFFIDYQWRMIPAMIKQFVMIYDSTIAVLTTAIRSLSWSVAPDFSPSALDHRRQSLALVDC